MSKQADLRKEAANFLGTTGPEGSWLSTLNPLSPVTAGGDRYPRFMAELWPRDPRTAWLVSKSAGLALLSAALMGGARHLIGGRKHPEEASRGTDSRLNVTFTPKLASLAKAPAANEQTAYPGDQLSWETVGNVAIPTAAMLLAGTAAWAAADEDLDREDADRARGQASRADARVRRLMRLRAMQARGTVTPEEAAAQLGKTAASAPPAREGASAGETLDPTVTGTVARAGVGLLGTALLMLAAGTGLTSYGYFSSTDPDNVRYRAMQRGLHSYARSKARMTPVSVIPRDSAEFFAGIDGEGKAKEDPRSQPESVRGLRPLSVTA